VKIFPIEITSELVIALFVNFSIFFLLLDQLLEVCRMKTNGTLQVGGSSFINCSLVNVILLCFYVVCLPFSSIWIVLIPLEENI
jgi:hypothetical protein